MRSLVRVTTVRVDSQGRCCNLQELHCWMIKREVERIGCKQIGESRGQIVSEQVGWSFPFTEHNIAKGWSYVFNRRGRTSDRPHRGRQDNEGVRRWCTHTLLSHAHFFCTQRVHCAHSAHLHACAHTRMAQVSVKGLLHAHVIDLRFSFSILMFHPPSLLFPDGHFETTFPTLTSTTYLPSFTCPKSAGQAHSLTSTEESWLSCQVRSQHRFCAQRVRQDHFLWTVTRRPSTIQTTMASLVSR